LQEITEKYRWRPCGCGAPAAGRLPSGRQTARNSRRLSPKRARRREEKGGLQQM